MGIHWILSSGNLTLTKFLAMKSALMKRNSADKMASIMLHKAPEPIEVHLEAQESFKLS